MDITNNEELTEAIKSVLEYMAEFEDMFWSVAPLAQQLGDEVSDILAE